VAPKKEKGFRPGPRSRSKPMPHPVKGKVSDPRQQSQKQSLRCTQKGNPLGGAPRGHLNRTQTALMGEAFVVQKDTFPSLSTQKKKRQKIGQGGSKAIPSLLAVGREVCHDSEAGSHEKKKNERRNWGGRTRIKEVH